MEKLIAKSEITLKTWLYLLVPAFFLASPAFFVGDIYAKIIFVSLPFISLLTGVLSTSWYFYDTYFVKKNIYSSAKKIYYSDLKHFKVNEGKEDFIKTVKIVLYDLNGQHGFVLTRLESEKLIYKLKEAGVMLK